MLILSTFRSGDHPFQAVFPPFSKSLIALENLLQRSPVGDKKIGAQTAGGDMSQQLAAISDALGIRICKNLFLCNRQKTDFYLLTMPEDKPFHTKDLSAQIGSSRLSFAPPELMEELIHCTPRLRQRFRTGL